MTIRIQKNQKTNSPENALSKNKTLSASELRERKEKLKRELDQIEEKYSSKITRAKNTVNRTLKPVKTIKESPFKAVGIAVIVGVLAGMTGRKKSSAQSDSGGSGLGFSSLLMGELKRLAARKAMVYVSDIVDQEVMPRIRRKKNEDSPSSEDS